MPILHKNITNATDIHNPKWLSTANNGDYAWKNEKGELESTDEIVLPAALNFVDASVAPPTSNNGDIYILASGGSVNAGWGSVAVGDWVRYDGALWNSITPQKSSLCYDETADTLNSFDGSVWSAIGGSSGILGIADATGAYTYYTTFALAYAAASSGDTIQLFTNIIETNNITVSCVDDVNVNFNGFTYTLNNSGNAHAFTINGSGVNIEFFNGKVLRTGNGSGSALYVSASGLLTVQGVIFENDFGTSASFNGSSMKVIGGYYYGAGMGVFVNSGKFENGYCKGGSSYGLWLQNNGTAINCNAYSLSNYGIENNNSNAYSCVGRSDGNYGFNAGGGSSYDCKGYSSASYGFRAIGAAKMSNVFGYSSANAGIILLGGTGTNITGYSTSSYGINYQSGSGDHIISNVTAYSTAASGMYVLKNAGKVEFSNLDVGTAWNSSNGHALQVTGSDNDIIFSGGSLRVQNASANCLFSGGAKSCYFVGLKFNNSTTAVNANITNLQSNTPDAYGNILIG